MSSAVRCESFCFCTYGCVVRRRYNAIYIYGICPYHENDAINKRCGRKDVLIEMWKEDHWKRMSDRNIVCMCSSH